MHDIVNIDISHTMQAAWPNIYINALLVATSQGLSVLYDLYRCTYTRSSNRILLLP